MNVDTGRMAEYAVFLEENTRAILDLCAKLEDELNIAMQCMDEESGRVAAQEMMVNLENIKNNVPISNETGKRLVLAKQYVEEAGSVFRR